MKLFNYVAYKLRGDGGEDGRRGGRREEGRRRRGMGDRRGADVGVNG